MPAIKLFGRKWLAATDDLVYPGLFEIFIRVVWLILIGVACVRYYSATWSCQSGGELVRVYLLGEAVILSIALLLMLVIVRHSAKGSIMDTQARKYVQPLLTVKILILLPEIAWNVLGSSWIFGNFVDCNHEDYTVTVVQALVFFDWILIGLTTFGLALIFDPLGSLDNKKLENSTEHGKISRIWLRRMRFLWWMRKDETANEAFQQVADIFAAIFRGSDLVPSDVMAGCILLRVRQKREIHEQRRLNQVVRPKCTSDAEVIFAGAPNWMSLDNLLHYMKLSVACYGWLFVIYQHMCTGCFRVIRNMTCCACFRRKRSVVIGDNCCFCYLAGVKYLSKLPEEDILFASVHNHLCEVPFCVIADHEKASIVIVIRGTLSVRDVITDCYASSEAFECEGLPPRSMAHRGMLIGAKIILRQLQKHNVLEKAFATHPQYQLTITGHSLGAGLAVLVGILLRPTYPDLKVYAFATPAGLLSREAAKVTEEFVLTAGVGDDFAMRLSVEAGENLRTNLLMTLHACRLPKYRVVLNGFGYALFGVPERDLNKTWSQCNVINTVQGELPLLAPETRATNQVENGALEPDITKRRYSKVRLYNAGRILHITRCKPDKKSDSRKSKKQSEKERKYEMRWAQPEDFTELLVMPRMLLDHLPENIELALETLMQQQNDLPFHFDP